MKGIVMFKKNSIILCTLLIVASSHTVQAQSFKDRLQQNVTVQKSATDHGGSASVTHHHSGKSATGSYQVQNGQINGQLSTSGGRGAQGSASYNPISGDFQASRQTNSGHSASASGSYNKRSGEFSGSASTSGGRGAEFSGTKGQSATVYTHNGRGLTATNNKNGTATADTNSGRSGTFNTRR
jgi:hypothetical protein